VAVTLGRRIDVLMPDGAVLKGVAEDVNGQGALMLRDDNGALRALHSGEVSLNVANAGG
jgi:BirA family transcriptional regulator, biotin operon repressor / biotin---[acetyl-CoA-carboxylase] ligase